MKRLTITLALFTALLWPTAGLAKTWYIRADGLGDAPTIQAGVDSSVSGDTLLLAAGTYTGVGNRDVNYNGKDIVVTSESGPDVTTINCQHLGRGFIFFSGESPTAVLNGVRISNGEAAFGGAIYVRTAQPTITGNIFSANHSTSDGGAICYDQSFGNPPPVLIAGNRFANNVADGRGGGIMFATDATTLADNVFIGNQADVGGGIFVHNFASGVVSNNVVTQNTAAQLGGGVYDDAIAVDHDGNTISGNSSGLHAGGMYISVSSRTFENCLIYENDTFLFGSGIYCGSNANPTIRNCTIVDNPGTSAVVSNGDVPLLEKCIVAFNGGAAFQCFNNGSISISCTNVFGNGSIGTCYNDLGNNFFTDPLFCDRLLDDYRIDPTSPCTAAGSPCSELVGALAPCQPTGIGDDSPAFANALRQNVPNPFNPVTTIAYELQAAGHVTLEIYNARGQRVRRLVSARLAAGPHRSVWDGRDDLGQSVSSGVYFYRLETGRFSQVRKMVLVR